MNTIHMIVKGRVQGVGFRYYTYVTAKKYDVKGTVRNLEDGDVEIFAQGKGRNLEEFKKLIHKGSHFSRVDRVVEEELEMELYKDFDLKY